MEVRKIPKVKELSAEYARILTEKKQAYAEYRMIKEEAQELVIAKMNIDSLYEAEKRRNSASAKEKKRIDHKGGTQKEGQYDNWSSPTFLIQLSVAILERSLQDSELFPR